MSSVLTPVSPSAGQVSTVRQAPAHLAAPPAFSLGVIAPPGLAPLTALSAPGAAAVIAVSAGPQDPATAAASLRELVPGQEARASDKGDVASASAEIERVFDGRRSRDVSAKAEDTQVTLLGLPVDHGWTASYVIDRGGFLVLVALVRGKEKTFVRLDLDKVHFIDPLRDGAPLSKRYAAKIAAMISP